VTLYKDPNDEVITDLLEPLDYYVTACAQFQDEESTHSFGDEGIIALGRVDS